MNFKAWREYGRRHPFAILFATLMVTLGIGPLLESLWRANHVPEMLTMLNLVVAVFCLRLGRTSLHWFLAIAIVAISMRWFLTPISRELLVPAGQLIWVLLSLAVGIGILRVALGSGHVDSERIFAALSLYILFGLAFGVLFTSVELIQPGSLSGIGTGPEDRSVLMNQTIYFSFVTLATLGYGDIVPVTPVTRGLANLESILGQLYLTVLVARLVSLYGTNAKVDVAAGRDA